MKYNVQGMTSSDVRSGNTYHLSKKLL